MKKYFLYEIKRNYLTCIVLTAFASIIYLISVLITDFTPRIAYNGNNYIPDSLVLIPVIILMVLCTLVPVLIFRFKMISRQADCFFSMPLRREKIYLIKALIGLLLIFIPYTIAYWLGFIATALKPNGFTLAYYIPLYFISILLAVLLFGFNSFVFSRAYRLIDGIIFIAFYTCAAALLCGYINAAIEKFQTGFTSTGADVDFSYWFSYSPLTVLANKYSELISKYTWSLSFEWLIYLFAIITGAGGWAGLFLTARKEKAENAEASSDSLFGYITLIPYYLTLGLILIDYSSGLSMLYVVIFLIAAIVMFAVFRRTFILKTSDWLILAGSFTLGLLLSFTT